MRREQRVQEQAAALRELLGVEPDASHEPTDVPSERDERILARIVAAAGSRVPGASRTRSTRRRSTPAWRVPALRASVALVTVVALGCAFLVWQSERSPASATTPAMLHFSRASVADVLAGDAPPAAEALERIAGRASAVEPVAGTGTQRVRSYAWYLTTAVDSGAQAAVELAPTFQSTTLAADGSFVNREVRAPVLTVTGRVADPDRLPAGGAVSEDRLPPGTLDPDYPATLPRDPEALGRAFVTAQGGEAVCGATDLTEATCLTGAIVDLYSHWVVPGDLSAAVWRTLARNAAVVDMGTTVDRLGRTGYAVAVPPDATGADQALILVIDPANGRLLAWERVSVTAPDTGLAGPVVSSFAAIADAEWVAP